MSQYFHYALNSGQRSFSEMFSQNSAKIFVFTLKGLEPTTSCVRDQDATIVPARHMLETGSLDSAQFMLQWFIRFLEFTKLTEFSESSALQCM